MSGRTLLVASPGGHIDELFDLVSRTDTNGLECLWVTAKTSQTTHLLARQQTQWVPRIASRQLGRAITSMPRATSLICSFRPDLVVSTGAALALPYILAARGAGVQCHYIESATRVEGPSLTGRILQRVPGMILSNQGSWSAPGWGSIGSVFDGYAPGPSTMGAIQRAVLTVGTERFPFTRAVEQVPRALPSGVTLLRQIGTTPVANPDAGTTALVPADELEHAMRGADVVITHAGVGSILNALRAGKHPVVIPRIAALGEHVDDHQLQIASALEARALVTVAMPGSDLEVLIAQAARRSNVRTAAAPISLRLSGARRPMST